MELLVTSPEAKCFNLLPQQHRAPNKAAVKHQTKRIERSKEVFCWFLIVKSFKLLHSSKIKPENQTFNLPCNDPQIASTDILLLIFWTYHKIIPGHHERLFSLIKKPFRAPLYLLRHISLVSLSPRGQEVVGNAAFFCCCRWKGLIMKFIHSDFCWSSHDKTMQRPTLLHRNSSACTVPEKLHTAERVESH